MKPPETPADPFGPDPTGPVGSRPPGRRGGKQTPWQPRFGIRELLMLMLICSMLAAALGYLYQDEKSGGRSMRFIFLTVAGPTLMAMGVGISFYCYEYFKNRGRKRKRPQDWGKG